ncbi:hypothetical protein ATANTOWER_007232 [Ataeniobius toweri]|uniref:Uncharacterized protein n=1 Tax=Ataeniobius toweri TaxID=208326 RepID=A0ABU7C089_9TELE|nr:hypothetical protein [Ataeniobius toweri]
MNIKNIQPTRPDCVPDLLFYHTPISSLKETALVEAGSWPTGPQSRGGHQRKPLLQSQQEVMLQEKYCY